jgi:hypothetical protein
MLWCVEHVLKDKLAGFESGLRQGVWLFLVTALFFAGCKKQEEKKPDAPVLPAVHADRSQDKAYRSALMESREQQARQARELLALSLKMTQCVTRVRATLPPEATADALQKALQSDQEWATLDTQLKQAEATVKETRKQAEALVRQRMQQELRDNKAIEEGKATALEPSQPVQPGVGK